MPLTTAQRDHVIRELVELVGPITASKSDVQAAVAAADTWLSDNGASFNTALPAAFRTTATNAQKAALLAFVALRRAGK